MKRLLQNELFRTGVTKFLPAIVASVFTGLIAGALGVYVMIHLMDARIANLEELPPRIIALERAATRFDPIEKQIARHEKALERDFSRHEQIVEGIAHKVEFHDTRLTKIETEHSQMKDTLQEIRLDVKAILRGEQH